MAVGRGGGAIRAPLRLHAANGTEVTSDSGHYRQDRCGGPLRKARSAQALTSRLPVSGEEPKAMGLIRQGTTAKSVTP